MAGGYKVIPTGPEGLAAKFADIYRRLDALASAAGLKNAIIPVGRLQYTDANGVPFLQLGTVQYQETPGDPLSEIRDVYGFKMVNAHGHDLLLVAQVTEDDGSPDPSVSAMIIGGAATKGTNPTDDAMNFSVVSKYFDVDTQYVILKADGVVSIVLGTGGMFIENLRTTGSAANVRLDPGTSELLQVTSSRRYKQDIEDAPVDPSAVLKLQGRTWRQKTDVEFDAGTDQRYIGFIAEEVDEAGLGLFVDYDDEGRPDAIQYDRISVALLELAKNQQKQLGEQADQIADLTTRLDALEAK